MIKAHKHPKAMRRSARVYLNDLNVGKSQTLVEFLHLCHDATQYFIDLFWQRQDFSAKLANLETVHKGCERFGITTRLSQALAKQAKEAVRSASELDGAKPELRKHVVSLYYHFVKVEAFQGSFDYAVKLIGSGAPRMIIPVKSTKVVNHYLADGWHMSKTIRLGRKGDRLYIDFIMEKARPSLKEQGVIIGMDSNYKNGFYFSDKQNVGLELYPRIQEFTKRQKHTHAEIKSMVGKALKEIDFSAIGMLCVEDLKRVKHKTRGKFPRIFNRRLSHWLYAYVAEVLARKCEEQGIRLVRKNPAYTSQFCPVCHRWDRRNRVGDKFKCVHCGFSNHADLHSSQNLALLGEAGVYGLRSLPNPSLC